MKFEGKLIQVKAGKKSVWHIEVPALDVATQGISKANAFVMIKDAIEVAADTEGFKVNVVPGEGDAFTVESPDTRTLVAFMLKRQRIVRGLTLEQVAHNLGINSPNAYARYEQGKSEPTVGKLEELLKALKGGKKPAPTVYFGFQGGGRRLSMAKAKPRRR